MLRTEVTIVGLDDATMPVADDVTAIDEVDATTAPDEVGATTAPDDIATRVVEVECSSG